MLITLALTFPVVSTDPKYREFYDLCYEKLLAWIPLNNLYENVQFLSLIYSFWYNNLIYLNLLTFCVFLFTLSKQVLRTRT